MITVEGIVLRSYSLLTALSVSSSTGKVTPSLLATSAALLTSSSTLTPSRTNPEPLYFSYRRLSCGISWRHGPHQVAQKLTITTRPRCSFRRRFGPPIACSVKSGAALAGAIADEAVPATLANAAQATSLNASRRRRSGAEVRFMTSRSEVEGQAAGELDVLRALALAEQVEREHVIAQVELQRGPVGEIDAIAEAGVEGGLPLLVELGAAHAGDDIELRRARTAAAEEDLAGEQVVADRQVVVGELLAVLLEDAAGQDLAEQLVAHLRLGVRALDEEVFGDVIADARAVDPARAEVLGRIRAREQSHLEVVRRELGLLDVAPIDRRHDHLVGVAGRLALGQRCDAGGAESADQESLAEGLVVHRMCRLTAGLCRWFRSKMSEEEREPEGLGLVFGRALVS